MLDEIQKDVELAYCDRFGRRNIEYISLGCDILPVLCGRSPIQVYADFMRDFRDTFRSLLGVIITVRFYGDLVCYNPTRVQIPVIVLIICVILIGFAGCTDWHGPWW